jgi:hypothetical protein
MPKSSTRARPGRRGCSTCRPRIRYVAEAYEPHGILRYVDLIELGCTQAKSDGDGIEQAQEGQGASRMEKKIKLMEKRLQPRDGIHEDDADADGGGDATTREEEVDPPK